MSAQEPEVHSLKAILEQNYYTSHSDEESMYRSGPAGYLCEIQKEVSTMTYFLEGQWESYFTSPELKVRTSKTRTFATHRNNLK